MVDSQEEQKILDHKLYASCRNVLILLNASTVNFATYSFKNSTVQTYCTCVSVCT